MPRLFENASPYIYTIWAWFITLMWLPYTIPVKAIEWQLSWVRWWVSLVGSWVWGGILWGVWIGIEVRRVSERLRWELYARANVNPDVIRISIISSKRGGPTTSEEPSSPSPRHTQHKEHHIHNTKPHRPLAATRQVSILSLPIRTSRDRTAAQSRRSQTQTPPQTSSQGVVVGRTDLKRGLKTIAAPVVVVAEPEGPGIGVGTGAGAGSGGGGPVFSTGPGVGAMKKRLEVGRERLGGVESGKKMRQQKEG